MALACALLLRALVPTGWMPAAHGGVLAIEPCPSAVAAPMMLSAGTHDHGPAKHSGKADQHAGDCAFSPLATAFDQVHSPAALLPIVAAASSLTGRAGLVPWQTGPPAPPPPARGPPAIA